VIPGIGVGIVVTGLQRIILKEMLDQVMIYAMNVKEKKKQVIVKNSLKKYCLTGYREALPPWNIPNN